MRLELPWPPKELNPNGRLHWSKVTKFKKAYRARCFICAKRLSRTISPLGAVPMTITFHPPDRRKRDDDNIIASFKAGRDGLADAWGVDDNVFRFTYKFGEPVKSGKVVITQP